jgi:hypothetical protein
MTTMASRNLAGIPRLCQGRLACTRTPSAHQMECE